MLIRYIFQTVVKNTGQPTQRPRVAGAQVKHFTSSFHDALWLCSAFEEHRKRKTPWIPLSPLWSGCVSCSQPHLEARCARRCHCWLVQQDMQHVWRECGPSSPNPCLSLCQSAMQSVSLNDLPGTEVQTDPGTAGTCHPVA